MGPLPNSVCENQYLPVSGFVFLFLEKTRHDMTYGCAKVGWTFHDQGQDQKQNVLYEALGAL